MGKRGSPTPPKPETAGAIRQASSPPPAQRPAQPTKRRFEAEFKLRILRDVDLLGASGERGAQVAFLRREGLTWTHVHRWQKERDQGGLAALTPKKRGPKPAEGASAKELERLRRQTERLKEQLRKAEIIIDVQKKLGALLGEELPVPPDGEEP
jgi:transposase-like protein